MQLMPLVVIWRSFDPLLCRDVFVQIIKHSMCKTYHDTSCSDVQKGCRSPPWNF